MADNYYDVTYIDAVLRNGYFVICRGDAFMLDNENIPVLSYIDNGIWHIESDPDPMAKGYFRLYIPYDYDLYKLKIHSLNSTVKIVSISVTEAEIYNDNSDISISSMGVRNIYMKIGKGSIYADISPELSTYINCGFGKAQIKLSGSAEDYKIRSKHGAGSVKVGGHIVCREWENCINSDNEVVIKCGLGSVQVDFEKQVNE